MDYNNISLANEGMTLELLSLEQLRLFVIAARSKSFSEVARSCGRTQSSVSVAINNLEVDTGVQLFVRGTQGVKLTQAGQALYPAALDVLSRMKMFEQRALRLSEFGTDQFTLHVDSFFCYDRLVRVVSELERRHPETEITVKIESPFDAFRNWIGRSEDLIISSRALAVASGADIRGFDVGQVGFVPVIGKDHLLAHQASVTKAELEAHRQVIFDVGRRNGQRNAGGRRLSVDRLTYQKRLILSGVGWGYMPEHTVRAEIQRGDLAVLKLNDDSYYPKLSFRLAWHASEPLQGIKQELVEMLKPANDVQGDKPC